MINFLKNKTMALAFLLAVSLTSVSVTSLAAGGGAYPSSGVNVHDIAAAQRGAKLFVNYCLSCHSADFMRYNRIAEDLDLGEELVMQHLVFSDAKIGETLSIAMKESDAELWFGKAPPDLSVIGRSRTSDWLYAYLINFYQDESGRWNNTVLKNASMPHVMWQLQGIQKPVYETHTDGGIEIRSIDHLELAKPGLQSPEEYEETVRDLVTFLAYMGEPAILKRKNIGVWVMLFLAIFALVAFLLKAEFWRDVH